MNVDKCEKIKRNLKQHEESTYKERKIRNLKEEDKCKM